jgi:hypothetical protein
VRVPDDLGITHVEPHITWDINVLPDADFRPPPF